MISILLLVSSISCITAAEVVASSSETVYVHGDVTLPEIDAQPNREEFVETYNGTQSIRNSTNTCPDSMKNSPISQLLQIQNKEERHQFIEEHGITVEHTFLNDASERFLYIENYHSTAQFLAGDVGAAEAFNAQNLNYNKENSFLSLKPKDCPSDDETGPCFTIENGRGQLYALKFKDNPYMFAFDNALYTDALMEGIVVFDAARFERVYSSGIWVLDATEDGLDEDDESAVLIRNVGTGRRLFAKHGFDKKDQFGGTPGTEEDAVHDDQRWRHCVRYSDGQEQRIDCSRYV